MIVRHKNAGFSLIEIMVTVVILMVGLLGLAGLQGRALTAQMESYQRSQALILLRDMADRISANRGFADSYVGNLDMTACPDLVAGSSVATDRNEWCNALLGAAETSTGGTNVGAMIGARGCITKTSPTPSGLTGQYVVQVAWQGLNSPAAPPASLACGAGQYGTDESKRRVIALPVNVGCLTC